MKEAASNYAFIDSQNLNLGIRTQGWRLDFRKFRIFLRDQYSVSKAFLFIGFLPENQRLYTALQEDGYILIFKPTLQLKDGRVEGNVDAELVLHAMIEYPNYGHAVIVSGDGDFNCLVEHLMRQNKLLRLIVPNQRNFSSLLGRLRAPMVFMNALRGKLERK